MAKITYVDQQPSSANSGQIGVSGTPYDKMYAQCIHGTTCVCSACLCSAGCITACSDIAAACGNLYACEVSGTGGCICAYCDICSGGTVYGTVGCFCCAHTDLLCYGSQGCICVCSCLIDCNGAEILGGSGGLWYDGGGYICANNSCPVCAYCFCSDYGYTAGGYAGCSTTIYYDYSGSSYYMCFCGGILIDYG